MIFKKPYAFLIKNFKIIHLLLLAMIIIITLKYKKIVSFFSDYINSSINVYEKTASQYIPFYLILISFIIIIFGILMYSLMKKKNKPKTFYLTLLIYYILVLISLIVGRSVIKSLIDATMTQQNLRAYHDIYLILLLPSFYFVIMSFVRGFGFDVKKFNFNKDLEDLELNSEDNEEFEFVLGNQTYIYKRKIRRILRELKYYFLENKLIIYIVGGVVLGVIILSLFLNYNILDKSYSKGATTSLNGFSFKLNNSYITAHDYNGNTVSSGKKYVLIDCDIKNNNLTATAFKSEMIFLTYGAKNVYSRSSLGDVFNDIGTIYTGGVINAATTKRVIIVFEIPNSISNNKFTLNLINGSSINDNGETEYKYIKYKITPIQLDSKITSETKTVNNNLNLGEKTFYNSYINIKEAKIVSSYEYKYDICNGSDCQPYYNAETVANPSSQKLLMIDYIIKLDDNALILNSMTSKIKDEFIFNDFLNVEYNINSKSYITKVKSRINSNVTNKIFMNISNVVADSDLIYLDINTRYYHYKIKIK